MPRRRALLWTAAVGITVGGARLAYAQAEPDPSKAKEAMRAIAFLQGEWQGEGSFRRGPGEPQRFRSTERVVPRLDGLILVVEGQHWSADGGRLVHDAFGVISADPAGGYRFDSYLATGRSGSFKGRVENGAFVWEIGTPQGRIRYTIRVEAGTWREVGEILRGDAWSPFFDMTLARK